MNYFEEMCFKIKIIVSEIDGIVTDGLCTVDSLGFVVSKQYYIKDFFAINELKKHFVFVFLSTETDINYAVCRKKSIPFYYTQKDKKTELVKIMRRYNVGPEEVLYVGHSFSDIDCMRMIPFTYCPMDSITDVKDISYEVLNFFSGEGILCEVYNRLKNEINRRKYLTSQ